MGAPRLVKFDKPPQRSSRAGSLAKSLPQSSRSREDVSDVALRTLATPLFPVENTPVSVM